MEKNHIIKFAVTKDQKEKILNNARVNGYLTISAYARCLLINRNIIYEIYDMLKKKKKKKVSYLYS